MEAPDLRAYGLSREGGRECGAKTWCELALAMVCISFFLVDLWVHCKGVGVWKTFRYKWTRLFVLLLAFDVMGMLWPVARVLIVSGIVRCFPIVYFSRKARNATLDYLRTVPSILQWIAVEYVTILVFACFGVVLFANIDQQGISGQDAFLSFKKAFISLYALSLTVNDPDVYLPYYHLHTWNVALFVVFLVLSFFLLHNIILARVFQIYSFKLKETALKRNEYRDTALVLAFQFLQGKDGQTGTISRALVAYMLQQLLPWYSREKNAALMDYVDRHMAEGGDSACYDLERFSLLMTAVGDDRLHTVRATASYSRRTQQLLDFLAVSEFVLAVGIIVQYWHYFYSVWFWGAMSVFRLTFILDMVYGVRQVESLKYYVRSNTHKCKLLALTCFLVAMGSAVFALLSEDGDVATLEAEQSTSKKVASLFLLLASSFDVFCLANRISEYAALLKVFKDLLVPAFLGQATVIFTLMHVFCYLGMYFFGGRIEASQAHWAALPVPASLYYLLNFNTYREGMLTLFMLMVVNNWNLISEQFVAVTHPAAYVYFMAFQVLMVTVALSCITSFFITHLSSQLEEELERERRKKSDEMVEGEEGYEEGGGGGRRRLPRKLRWGAWGGRRGRSKERVGTEGRGEEERRNSTGRGGEEEEFEPGLKEATGGGPASSSLSSSIPTPLPLPARPTRFRMEKRVTSGGLVLRNEQPVAAVQYRRLLDIMVREKGRKSGYCFVKEKRHKSQREIIQRSLSFARITQPYPDIESRILQMCEEMSMKEKKLRKPLRDDEGLIDFSRSSSFSSDPTVGKEGGRGREGKLEEEEEEEDGAVKACVVVPGAFPHPLEEAKALHVRVYLLTEGEASLAYCQIQEE
ncbi:two-pore calcium channel [Nannochloropsis oceanica]